MIKYININMTIEVSSTLQVEAEAEDLINEFEEIIAQKSFDLCDSTYDITEM